MIRIVYDIYTLGGGPELDIKKTSQELDTHLMPIVYTVNAFCVFCVFWHRAIILILHGLRHQ